MIRILGGYWLLNTAVLKLHDFVDLRENNATENRHAVKGRDETCACIMLTSAGIACMT